MSGFCVLLLHNGLSGVIETLRLRVTSSTLLHNVWIDYENPLWGKIVKAIF